MNKQGKYSTSGSTEEASAVILIGRVRRMLEEKWSSKAKDC